jgi:hypothetical protein
VNKKIVIIIILIFEEKYSTWGLKVGINLLEKK